MTRLINDDLISRQAAIDAINTWDKFGVDERNRVVKWHEGLEPYIHLRDVVTAIINLPSAQPDPVPVVHGKWIHDGYDFPHGVDWMHCSNCGKRDVYCPAARTNYCPNCGARMDGEG